MDEEQTQISIDVLDSALTYLQQANKRLARLLALSLIVLALMSGGLLYVIA
jgi:hypothetical protein